MGGMWSRSARIGVGLAVVMASGAIAAVVGAARAGLHAQVTAPAAEPAAADAGRTIYRSKCIECHGESGRGDGPAATFMTPRPRDFTSGKYKIKSTPESSVPTDDDLIRSVKVGLPGSTMPGWEDLLSDTDVRAVVGYIKTMSPRFAGAAPQPIPIPAGQPATPESLAHGAKLYEKLQCTGCHGTDGRGAGAIAGDFEDDWGQPLVAADLTEPWTFHGGATPRDIYMRLRTGLPGTPMPSFAEAATEAETWDVANYVASLGRTPVWSMTAAEVSAFYAARDAERRADPVRHGRYLVDTMGCALCHSPIDDRRRVLPGMKFAGGLRLRIEPFGDYPTGNLTSDNETGLGKWSDGDIKRVLTTGTLPDGTRMLPFPMDWPSYSTMNPEDIDAIVKYLRTIPPVSNKVPRPSRKFLPMYLWGKLQMLLFGIDQPIRFYPGNAGSATGGRS